LIPKVAGGGGDAKPQGESGRRQNATANVSPREDGGSGCADPPCV